MNSVLQCLAHTPPLAELCLRDAEELRLPGRGAAASQPGAGQFDPIAATSAHIKRVHAAAGGAVRPVAHARHLRALNKRFRLGRQEDAHEFLRCLLDAMHEAVLRPLQPKPPADLAATTFVHRIFGGRLRSQIVCEGVSYSSSTFDPFLDLSLEIARAGSLTKALAHFTAVEVLDGPNRYRCPTNGQLVRARKRITIDTPPNVLTVHLKRFDFMGRGHKVSRRVEFEFELDISPYMSEPAAAGAPHVYDLGGVLVHQGGSLHSGHYVAYVRAGNGAWYLADDQRVAQVSARLVLGQQAYMLFYVRRHARCGGRGGAAVAAAAALMPGGGAAARAAAARAAGVEGRAAVGASAHTPQHTGNGVASGTLTNGVAKPASQPGAHDGSSSSPAPASSSPEPPELQPDGVVAASHPPDSEDGGDLVLPHARQRLRTHASRPPALNSFQRHKRIVAAMIAHKRRQHWLELLATRERSCRERDGGGSGGEAVAARPGPAVVAQASPALERRQPGVAVGQAAEASGKRRRAPGGDSAGEQVKRRRDGDEAWQQGQPQGPQSRQPPQQQQQQQPLAPQQPPSGPSQLPPQQPKQPKQQAQQFKQQVGEQQQQRRQGTTTGDASGSGGAVVAAAAAPVKSAAGHAGASLATAPAAGPAAHPADIKPRSTPLAPVTGAAALQLLAAEAGGGQQLGQALPAWEDADADLAAAAAALRRREQPKRRERDDWDEEYDRGKVKKVRGRCRRQEGDEDGGEEGGGGGNRFQRAWDEQLPQKARQEAMRGGNQGGRPERREERGGRHGRGGGRGRGGGGRFGGGGGAHVHPVTGKISCLAWLAPILRPPA